ncbi:hypothetical protein RV420_330099 [Roseovarius sp. EC-SD190]|nr:hypothetical protein RV420_330099 [Roseovarius sp. EC-SD190]
MIGVFHISAETCYRSCISLTHAGHHVNADLDNTRGSAAGGVGNGCRLEGADARFEEKHQSGRSSYYVNVPLVALCMESGAQ